MSAIGPLVLVLALVSGAAVAQTAPTTSGPAADPAAATAEAVAAAPEATDPSAGLSLAERQRLRFPQPVAVGMLPGRKLLAPDERQAILGRVRDVVDGGEGLRLVIELPGWLGLPFPAGRDVAVPAGAVALLGEHVALIDLAPDALAALPDFDPASATSVAADRTIEMGIVRPFH